MPMRAHGEGTGSAQGEGKGSAQGEGKASDEGAPHKDEGEGEGEDEGGRLLRLLFEPSHGRYAGSGSRQGK